MYREIFICLLFLVLGLAYYTFHTKIFTKKCSCGFRSEINDKYCRKCGKELPASYLKVRRFNKRIKKDLERSEEIVDMWCDFSEYLNNTGSEIEYVFTQSQSKNGTIYSYKYRWINCYPCRRKTNCFEIIVDYNALQVKFFFNNDPIDINLSNEDLLFVFQEGEIQCLE